MNSLDFKLHLRTPTGRASFVQLSSSASDSGVSDDDFNSGYSASAKRPRVSDVNVPLKKPKLEDGILPIGFLDPLPPLDTPEVIIARPISVAPPPASTAVIKRCKQFWKAGDYDGQSSADSNSMPVGMDHVRVHPKFLHSNATSHKWALGALAELLDNSMDEVCHGATFVNIDMVKNTKDGTKMLLVEDNGGGMDPDKMRQCMSLGYSVKSKSANTIGQYGNGFKTSTMRLGADVIVFSRCRGKDGRSFSQSIGLLSYTFLRSTGKEDTVVPMIDYVKEGEGWAKMPRSSSDVWKNNLETIVQWSPYYSEADLLQQFNSMTDQGTRIVIYNLWDDDQGELELDFDADQHDIQIRGANRDEKKIQMAKQFPNSRHFLTYRHSLRSYASILYLRLPPGFRMILRGKEIEHHNIATDMMLKQEVTYRPLSGLDGVSKGPNMVAVVTIGFVKDAKDHIDIQGFNVYHKNRLIKPFWRIWNAAGSDGRGVIGVLEANFVEPAHDKQGFERTTVLSRLEARLLQMQKTYWKNNCHKIGYAPRCNKKFINGSEDKASFPEAPQSSLHCCGKGPQKSTSPDYSKNDKAHDLPGLQKSGKSSLHSSRRMAESLKKSSPFEEVALCEGAEVKWICAKFKASDVISNGSGLLTENYVQQLADESGLLTENYVYQASDVISNGSALLTENYVQQLADENKSLKIRLNELEEKMLHDLQCEGDKNKSLTEQIAALEEKLRDINNEQEALINIFQEERSRRDANEVDLKNKLKEKDAIIRLLSQQVYSTQSHVKHER